MQGDNVRADQARKKMAAIAIAVPSVPELTTLLALSHSAGLKLNNKEKLFEAADKVASVAKALLEKYDGSTLAGVDKLLPPPSTYRGTSWALWSFDAGVSGSPAH